MPLPEEPTVPFQARLRIGDESVLLQGRAQTGSMRLVDFLPVLQSFDNAITDAAARAAERMGKQISCSAGCGACCRQMVPLGDDEAARLLELVEQMPEERREEVRERFRDAVRRLSEAGLLDCVRSVHPDRPLRCREYLVTSPAENCRDPGRGRIEMVPIPRSVSSLLFRFLGEGERPRWTPMILMLEWAEQHSGEPLPRFDGRALFETFLKQISRSDADEQAVAGDYTRAGP